MGELMRAGPIHLGGYLSELVCNLVIAVPLARAAKVFKTEDVPCVDAERGGLFGYPAKNTGKGLVIGDFYTRSQFRICRVAAGDQQC